MNLRHIKVVVDNFRKTFEKFYNLVMQVTIVRPLLMFIAAVLWTDNMYIPGYVSPFVIPYYWSNVLSL